MPTYINIAQQLTGTPTTIEYDIIVPTWYDAHPKTPIDIHFPKYHELHPLSLTEKQSIYSKCTNFDILDNVRDDFNILNEKIHSKIKNAFHLFGIWPRSRYASYKHLEVGSGWILLEFDSASNKNIEFSSYFVKENNDPANLFKMHKSNMNNGEVNYSDVEEHNFSQADNVNRNEQSIKNVHKSEYMNESEASFAYHSNLSNLSNQSNQPYEDSISTSSTKFDRFSNNQKIPHSEETVEQPQEIIKNDNNFGALIYALAFEKSLFFWVYFPTPGLWKWTLLFRKNSNDQFTPCFEYNIVVRRSWDYNFGGFTPILFDNTCIHCDERIQLIQPLQYFLQENTVVKFELWLNKKLYTNVGVLLRRKNCRKRVFFLETKNIKKNKNSEIKSKQHSSNSKISKLNSRHKDNNFELYTGDVLLYFPDGSSQDETTVTILLFENNDLSLENSLIVTTYIVQPQIQFVNTLWEDIPTTSDFIDFQNLNTKYIFGEQDRSISYIFNDVNNNISNYPLGIAPSLSPKNHHHTKSSVYENISRFWTSDIHLFLPKTRYLRANERTKFKLRLANTHSVYVRNGKISYNIPKAVTYFQGTYGEEGSRMELFESTIIFKDPIKKSSNDVYLYSIKFGNEKKEKCLIAQFILLPSLKKIEEPLETTQNSNNQELQYELPSPEHRALTTTKQSTTEEPFKPNYLPNLRPEITFINQPQMVYTVEYTKIPKKIIPKLKKHIPFLKESNQVDIETYEAAKKRKKHEIQLELEEYWKQLKKSQKESLNDTTLVIGNETNPKPASYEETRNELSNILLKRPIIDEIAQKKGKLSRSFESYPKELSQLLANRYNTIDIIKNIDVITPINSKRNPILRSNQIFKADSLSQTNQTVHIRYQEDLLYGLKNQLPKSRGHIGKTPKHFHRAALLSSSYREEAGKSTIDEIMNRVGNILPHDDIRKLTEDIVFSDHEVEIKKKYDPVKLFKKKEDVFQKLKRKFSNEKKEEIDFVYQKSLSPRKIIDEFDIAYMNKSESPLIYEYLQSNVDEIPIDENLDKQESNDIELKFQGIPRGGVDWDNFTEEILKKNQDSKYMYEDQLNSNSHHDTFHVVPSPSPFSNSESNSHNPKNHVNSFHSQFNANHPISLHNRKLSPSRKTSPTRKNSPTKQLGEQYNEEDALSKEELGKRTKLRLLEEKERMKERREQELKVKMERARQLKAQKQEEFQKKKELEEKNRIELQDKVAREKEDNIIKLQNTTNKLKELKKKESQKQRQVHKQTLEMKKQDDKLLEAEKKAKVKQGKINIKATTKLHILYKDKIYDIEFNANLYSITSNEIAYKLHFNDEIAIFQPIIGLKNTDTEEILWFTKNASSPFIELQGTIDSNCTYEIIQEDFTNLRTISPEDVKLIESIFKSIPNCKDDMIHLENLVFWQESVEKKVYDLQMEVMDGLILSKPTLAHEINERRVLLRKLFNKNLKNLSQIYINEYNKNQSAKHLSQLEGYPVITLEIFSLFEGRRKMIQKHFESQK